MNAFGGLTLLGLSVGATVFVGLIALLVAAYFMKLGAKAAGIENPTLGRSLIAILGGGILAGIIAEILFFLPGINIIIAFIVYIWVIKAVFDTGWGRAFLAWLISIIIAAVTFFVLGLIIVVL
ncbi:hypothetical protein [Thermococcus sp.]|uniref:hypothetical protein n=1 Tax=Thermococcus sp. TaxID=35749 RepID=UPI0025D26BF8|nr:hypothetical protein [Thermococcus sp.]